MGGKEREFIRDAFEKNFISTVGENLVEFEKAFTGRLGGLPCAALASGTAAIHLGLRLLGVGPGDEVFCSDLTFAASCNPIRYLGAEPVFIDSDRTTWNMDPVLLEEALRGRRPRAIVVVHLYGQCADMGPIMELAARYGVPVLEDAAEALGATYRGRAAGTFGDIAAFSFNGNKIITTSGGGMLAARDREMVYKARFWSEQAKDPDELGAYVHTEIGYNYRMSNVLAGIGRGQLEVLDDRVRQRRAVFARYRAAFADVPDIEPMPEPEGFFSTRWLSCFLAGSGRDELIRALQAENIDSRPVWKPMHMQAVYKDAPCYGGGVSEDLFARGICLPSSSCLTEEQQARVIEGVLRYYAGTSSGGRAEALTLPQYG